MDEQEPRRSARETKGQRKEWDMDSSLGSSPSQEESPKSTSASKSGAKEEPSIPKTPSRLAYTERVKANTQANMGALKAKSAKVRKIRAPTSANVVRGNTKDAVESRENNRNKRAQPGVSQKSLSFSFSTRESNSYGPAGYEALSFGVQTQSELFNLSVLEGEDGGIASEHIRRLKFPQPGQWIDSLTIMEARDPTALKPGQHNFLPGGLDYLVAVSKKQMQSTREALDRENGDPISPSRPRESQVPRVPFEYGYAQSTMESTRRPSLEQQLPEQNMLQSQLLRGVGAGPWRGSFSWSAYGHEDAESDQISDSDGKGTRHQRDSSPRHHPDKSPVQARTHIHEKLERRPSTAGHVATAVHNLEKVTHEIVSPRATNLERSELEDEWRQDRAIALSSDETYDSQLTAHYNFIRNRVALENPQWEDPVTPPDYPANSLDDLANPPPPPQQRRRSDPTINAWIKHRRHMDEAWYPRDSKADATAAKALDRSLQNPLAGEAAVTTPESDSRADLLHIGRMAQNFALGGQNLKKMQQANSETVRLEFSKPPLELATLPLVSVCTTGLANEPKSVQALVPRLNDLSTIKQISNATSAERSNAAVQGTEYAPDPAADEPNSADCNITVMMFTLPKGPSVEELVAASPFSFILKMISKKREAAVVDRRFVASSFQRQMMDLRAVRFRAAQLGFGDAAAQQQRQPVQSSLLRGSGQEAGEEEDSSSPSPLEVSAARSRRLFTLPGTVLPLPASTARYMSQRSPGQASNLKELHLDVDNGPLTVQRYTAEENANLDMKRLAAGHSEESKIEREKSGEEVLEKEDLGPNERLSSWTYRSLAVLGGKITALEMEMEVREEGVVVDQNLIG